MGRFGESVAVAELRKRGYEIIERNYRIRLGEIDIVAKHGGEIVFVEVKTRSSAEGGDPQDSVTKRKGRRLVTLGMIYLAEKRLDGVQWRIDVVAVRVGRDGRAEVEVLQGAVEE